MMNTASSAKSVYPSSEVINSMARQRVLLVDDHADIREPLSLYLEKQGFDIIAVANAAAMWAVLRQHTVDLIVLDVLLGESNGVDLCRELTSISQTPVIFLTGMAEYQHRIEGLNAGADDYLIKPFDPAELAARIRTVLRRCHRPVQEQAPARCIEFDGWLFNVAARELFNAEGQRVVLSEVEYRLLSVLVKYSGEILSRDRLLDLMKPDELSIFDRSIDTQICRLRKKLEPSNDYPRLIKTVRGGGYLFAITPRIVQL